MTTKGGCHRSYFGLLFVIAASILLAALILLSGTAAATKTAIEPGTGDDYSGHLDIWYMSQNSYRYAGLNIDNPYDQPKIITGIRMSYNCSDDGSYGHAVVQRGYLLRDNDAKIRYDIDEFEEGSFVTQSFMFTGSEYLVVDTDYNIQLNSRTTNGMQLQYTEVEEGNSYYRDHLSQDWKKKEEHYDEPSLVNRDWAMNALVEPVMPLLPDISQTNFLSSDDVVDAYYLDLVRKGIYIFSLEHSSNADMELYLYDYCDSKGNPGIIGPETLLKSNADDDPMKKITLNADSGGRYYVLVKRPLSQTGGDDSYVLHYSSNQVPVPEAGDDIYANIELGGHLELDFDGSDSFDPDDDTNGNDRIDGGESDNLEYYWDFDTETDDNKDGNPANDRDAMNVKSRHTFDEGGVFTVTLTVVDGTGTSATDTMDVHINYKPVVKINMTLDGDGEDAFVGEIIKFSAAQCYDPEDDLNGNGIIDWGEPDTLTYCWDFYHLVDSDQDGDFTNDLDYRNRILYMKYDVAGRYVVTLWVTESGENPASNCTQTVLIVKHPIIVPFDNIVEHEDTCAGPGTSKACLTEDVVVRTLRITDEPEMSVGGYRGLNILKVTACTDNGYVFFTMTTEGDVIRESSNDCRVEYRFYIVRKDSIEPIFDEYSIENVYPNYLYCLMVQDNRTKCYDEYGKVEDIRVNTSMEMRVISISVPIGELEGLQSELRNGTQLDIFAVTTYYRECSEEEGMIEIFARDSAGANTASYRSEWFGSGEASTGTSGRSVKDGVPVLIFLLVLNTAIVAVFYLLRNRAPAARSRRRAVNKGGKAAGSPAKRAKRKVKKRVIPVKDGKKVYPPPPELVEPREPIMQENENTMPPSVKKMKKPQSLPKSECMLCKTIISDSDVLIRCSCGALLHYVCITLIKRCPYCGLADIYTTRDVFEDEISKRKETVKLKMTRKDCAAMLGVRPEANQSEIIKGYRKKVKRYHPDRVQTMGDEIKDVAENKTKEITAAYRFLINN